METYGHGVKVSFQLLGDFVCKLAPSYPGAILRPAQRSNLLPSSAREAMNGTAILT